MFCLLSAVSKLLHISEAEIIQALGHDGQQVIWPEAKAPYCYRNFDLDEILRFCITKGVALVPHYAETVIENPLGDTWLIERPIRLEGRGIILGNTPKGPHAEYYDGSITPDQFDVTIYLRAFEIK